MSKKAWAKLVVIAVSVIVFILLLIQNIPITTELRFLAWEREFQLILLMVVLFALGFVAGIFTAFKVSARNKKKRKLNQ